jgi:PASTA domain
VRLAIVVVAVLLTCTACDGGKKAEALVRVPDVRGLPTQETLERLARAKLCVSHVDREPGFGAGPERVVDQQPHAGARVRLLHQVSFRTSPLPLGGEIVEVVAPAGCPAPALPLFRLPAAER